MLRCLNIIGISNMELKMKTNVHEVSGLHRSEVCISCVMVRLGARFIRRGWYGLAREPVRSLSGGGQSP